jgi:hypothetical protein
MAGWLSLSRALGNAGPKYATDTIALEGGGFRSGMKGKDVIPVSSRARMSAVTGDGSGGGAPIQARYSGGGSGKWAQQEKEKRDLLMKYGAERQDLIDQEQDSRNAARQSVTAAMDSVAQQRAAQDATRAKGSIYSGDGSLASGGARKVSVSGALSKLDDLRLANAAARKKSAMDEKWGRVFNPKQAEKELKAKFGDAVLV